MKMKNVLAGILAGSLILGLTACGSSNGGNAGGSNAGGSGSGGEARTLSIGYTTASNADDPYHVTALRFT